MIKFALESALEPDARQCRPTHTNTHTHTQLSIIFAPTFLYSCSHETSSSRAKFTVFLVVLLQGGCRVDVGWVWGGCGMDVVGVGWM